MINSTQDFAGFYGIAPEHELRAEHDNLATYFKIGLLAASIFLEIYYLFQHVGRLLYSSNQYHNLSEKVEWKEKSDGLYVLIHGLHSHPSIWNPQIASIKKKGRCDYFAPQVPHRGNCSLEEAAAPLLPTIRDYIKKHPDRPICLLGTSNGGRIALWLEVKLREEAKGTAVMVSTIAGAHFGSSRVKLAEDLQVGRYFISKEVREELRFGSDAAQQLLTKVLKPYPKNSPRSYDFFATAEDALIPNMNSSLLRLNRNERHFVVHGCGHNSIVSRVCKKQMVLCNQWIDEQLKR